jgi:hypothetical protein
MSYLHRLHHREVQINVICVDTSTDFQRVPTVIGQSRDQHKYRLRRFKKYSARTYASGLLVS